MRWEAEPDEIPSSAQLLKGPGALKLKVRTILPNQEASGLHPDFLKK